MAQHTITLSESTYHSLLAAAEAQGMSPESWIASQLSPSNQIPQPSSDFPADLIGVINSKVQPFQGKPVDEDDLFGQCLVEKMAKQGIHLP